MPKLGDGGLGLGPGRSAAILVRQALCGALLAWAGGARAEDHPSLLLITLDTTRADQVGRVVDGKPLTPNLDALARSGTRFSHAVTSSPLTLPAHCSLMTGAIPPVHGVRDNGVSALPGDLPTLATVLSARGYATGAFVSSRVLDRRFGLDRGFDVYDDAMVAERIGEQGYPERDAAAVTDAALAWIGRVPAGKPWFLWVHYYDAHAPYEPPGNWAGASAAQRYAGEVAYVDRQIGRLLGGLPGAPGGRVVAAVGDHGEMLGEHGEKEHGIFLYRAALEVPLLISGPGVPPGRSVPETVGTRGLATTLLRLLGLGVDAKTFGPPLPGLNGESVSTGAPVYSESLFPADAYGWSPLRAATDSRWKLVVAPRPELYDLSRDPTESHNLFGSRPEEERRLRRAILDDERSPRTAPPAASAELAESLRRLGYLSGSSPRGSGMDPKDGIVLLDDFDAAKDLIREGRSREAMLALQALVRKSPGNVPFMSRLGEAQVAAGETSAGLATLLAAIALNPGLDFLHARLARVYADLGRAQEARAEWEEALALNPRLAEAWLGLAELDSRSRNAGAELATLRRGEASGTESALLLVRMAQLEMAGGDLALAGRHAESAVRMAPEVGTAWWVAGEVLERQTHTEDALERFEKAVALGVADPRALVHVGVLLQKAGRSEDARVYLRRAAASPGGSPAVEEAKRLLAAR